MDKALASGAGDCGFESHRDPRGARRRSEERSLKHLILFSDHNSTPWLYIMIPNKRSQFSLSN
ncbi:hypothetical protein L484_004498 [Morus notabilis]|uniref:Uncharacterized protein n=1 Tax=Morus notabilis TaxID=981085 RepID=W9QW51_9ROSA|nr:hypothetical protein L484_004498 [Morus notabilis]